MENGIYSEWTMKNEVYIMATGVPTMECGENAEQSIDNKQWSIKYGEWKRFPETEYGEL